MGAHLSLGRERGGEGIWMTVLPLRAGAAAHKSAWGDSVMVGPGQAKNQNLSFPSLPQTEPYRVILNCPTREDKTHRPSTGRPVVMVQRRAEPCTLHPYSPYTLPPYGPMPYTQAQPASEPKGIQMPPGH